MSEQQSHAGRRPFLSRVAEQYVRSFSVFKQISLSAAASELVVRGAQSWLEQHQTETIPHVPADDPKAPREAAAGKTANARSPRRLTRTVPPRWPTRSRP
jgi:hypothetical protein